MADKGDYSIKEIYQGGYSTLEPSKNEYFTGYNTSAGSLGITSNPGAPSILTDVSTKLAGGSKHIELALVSPQILDMIPKQHLKEVNRLAKLTGVDVSVHGPVIDSAGMTQNGWSESQRQASERKIFNTLERSKDMSTTGNTIVVFHSAEGITGTEWETLGKDRKARRLIAVDKESGRLIPLEKDTKFYPGGEENSKIPFIEKDDKSPEENLRIQNSSIWRNEMDQLIFNKERADEILNREGFQINHLISHIEEQKANGKKDREILETLTPTQKNAWMNFNTVNTYIGDLNTKLFNQFSKAYELGDSKQREILTELSKEYKKQFEKTNGDLLEQSKIMTGFMFNLKNPVLAPKQFVPIEEFAVEKSSKTFGNAAFQAYKKFGDKAPIMAIENPPAGFSLSTGEDLANLVKASREEFAKKLSKEKGIKEKEANKIAEKFIGATWDVGHINMLRGQGFSEEDIVKESEKIAPFVKHVHLSDNFGFEHTELPMGMGNVPMKKIMEKLGKKGFEAKKIVEAADWWKNFQTNPIRESLEGLGSPIYSDGVGPYWNQSLGFQQGYFGGYGSMLPTTHFSQLYGAGFSSTSLPFELGGNVGGGVGGRMGGGRE